MRTSYLRIEQRVEWEGGLVIAARMIDGLMPVNRYCNTLENYMRILSLFCSSSKREMEGSNSNRLSQWINTQPRHIAIRWHTQRQTAFEHIRCIYSRRASLSREAVILLCFRHNLERNSLAFSSLNRQPGDRRGGNCLFELAARLKEAIATSN